MISFQPTENEVLARDMFSDFAQNAIQPLTRSLDDDGTISDELLSAMWQSEVVQSLLDNQELEDGRKRSKILSCIILEEIARADASVAVALGASMGYVQAIIDFGTTEQREKLQSDYRQETFRSSAVVLTEPGFDFNLKQLSTRAEKVNDGFVISGFKSCVPSFNKCDEYLVIAQCEGKNEAFIVPATTAGITVSAPAGTLGLQSLALTDVHFEQVSIPAGNQLGGDNGAEVESLISSARAGLSVILTGLSRAVFDHTVSYTSERVVHGSELAKKQSVAFRIADMRVDIPSMRWLCWSTAAAQEKGRSASRESKHAQLFCAKRGVEIADEGLQLMGGHGYMRDNPVERWYRDAQMLASLEGIVGI